MFQFDSTPEGNCFYTATMHQLNIRNHPNHQMNVWSEMNLTNFRQWFEFEAMGLLLNDEFKDEIMRYGINEDIRDERIFKYKYKYFPANEAQIPDQYWFSHEYHFQYASCILKKSILICVVKRKYEYSNREDKEEKPYLEFVKFDENKKNELPQKFTSLHCKEFFKNGICIDPQTTLFYNYEYNEHYRSYIHYNDVEKHKCVIPYYKKKIKKVSKKTINEEIMTLICRTELMTKNTKKGGVYT